MLQEMGVRVWWPELLASAPASSQKGSDKPAVPQVTVDPSNAGAAALEASNDRAPDRGLRTASLSAAQLVGVSTMDWVTLAQTIATCQACKLCIGRRAAVFAAGAEPTRADWLVVGEAPDDDEDRLGTPFAGQAGLLLDNMLKALGVSRGRPDGVAMAAANTAYLSDCVKCRPAVIRNPELQELATCESYLKREVELVQPKVILALGRFAAQTLLQGSMPEVSSIPLGKLRGQIYRYQGIPVIVSYHPAYLLRTPQDKARSWADLCLALAAKAV